MLFFGARTINLSYPNSATPKLSKIFELTITESSQLFANVPEIEPSELLTTLLKGNIDLAVSINTKKALSEMIIVPIFLEIRRKLNYHISLFFGIEFNVDPSKGLNEFCDFLMSNSQEQLFISTPILAIVEAKNENLKAGLGHCIAEMVAAQLFNQQEGNEISIIYGAVTTGTVWQLLKLENKVVSIDLTEYFIRDIQKIIGLLIKAMNG